MAGNQNSGNKPIWATPQALLKDFVAFLEYQKPHKENELRNVHKIRDDRKHIKNPKSSDYEYVIEEVEMLTRQGLVTITQFAAWKGVHRTSITTGYSEGKFKDVYQKMLAICEAYGERRLYEAERNAANIIFAMKNSYGWVDETKHDISGSLDTPLSDEAKAALNKALNGGGDGNPD
jgi:hypothetical protein